MKKKIVIIGAGASGLCAAVKAASSGAEVVVLEHTGEIGKKLLMTGNGKCNYTNTDMSVRHFHSFSDPDGKIIGRVLSAFGYEETIAFFKSIGVMPKIKQYGYDDGGYVYPASGEARSVLRALKSEADFHNVQFFAGCHIYSIAHMRDRNGRPVFSIDTNLGMIRADALIAAAGSCAAPKTGSDGTGHEIPCAFGHTIWDFVPSLCALRCVGSFFRELKGVRHDCRLRLRIAHANEETTALRIAEHSESQADNFGFLTEDMIADSYESYGEVQFTDYGLSGIPVFQLSRYVSIAVKLRRERQVFLDMLPDYGEAEARAELFRRREIFADRTADSFLNGLLPEKLAKVLLDRAKIERHLGVYLIEDEALLRLLKLIKGMKIGVLDTNGFDSCQCCAGGIDLTEIDPETMESQIVPELYFAGELLDADGDCGGYNLQWAWSTGALAGMAAAEIKRYRQYPEVFETNAGKGPFLPEPPKRKPQKEADEKKKRAKKPEPGEKTKQKNKQKKRKP